MPLGLYDLPSDVLRLIQAALLNWIFSTAATVKRSELEPCVINLRTIDKAFAQFFYPFTRLLCPPRTVKFGAAFAEGAIGVAMQCARFKELLVYKSHLMISLQTKVYAGCTTRPPWNQSAFLYDALAPKLKAMLSSGAIDPNPVELKALLRFLCYVYGYLDRYFVKMQKAPTIKASLMAAADAAGATVAE